MEIIPGTYKSYQLSEDLKWVSVTPKKKKVPYEVLLEEISALKQSVDKLNSELKTVQIMQKQFEVDGVKTPFNKPFRCKFDYESGENMMGIATTSNKASVQKSISQQLSTQGKMKRHRRTKLEMQEFREQQKFQSKKSWEKKQITMEYIEESGGKLFNVVYLSNEEKQAFRKQQNAINDQKQPAQAKKAGEIQQIKPNKYYNKDNIIQLLYQKLSQSEKLEGIKKLWDEIEEFLKEQSEETREKMLENSLDQFAVLQDLEVWLQKRGLLHIIKELNNEIFSVVTTINSKIQTSQLSQSQLSQQHSEEKKKKFSIKKCPCCGLEVKRHICKHTLCNKEECQRRSRQMNYFESKDERKKVHKEE